MKLHSYYVATSYVRFFQEVATSSSMVRSEVLSASSSGGAASANQNQLLQRQNSDEEEREAFLSSQFGRQVREVGEATMSMTQVYVAIITICLGSLRAPGL